MKSPEKGVKKGVKKGLVKTPVYPGAFTEPMQFESPYTNRKPF